MLDCQINDPINNLNHQFNQNQIEEGKRNSEDRNNNKNNKMKGRGSSRWIGLSERMEIERIKRYESGLPDSWISRKFMIFIVLGIYIYTYYVFIIKVSIPMIRMNESRLGNLTQGIIYTVIYHLLFLMFLWTYGMVITTSPGFARDFVEKTEPPPEDVELVEYAQQTFEHFPSKPFVSPSSPITSTSEPPSSYTLTKKEESPEGKVLIDEDVATTEVKHPIAAAFGTTIANLVEQTSSSKDVSSNPPTEISSSSLEVINSNATTSSSITYPPQIHHKSPSSSPLPLTPSTILPPNSSSPSSPTPPKSPSTHSYLHFPPPPSENLQSNGFKPIIERQPVKIPILTETYRYDFKEGLLKPFRSHRCRHCATVVLRMDHHCPWVGGCVGARNYKYFMNFVLWSSIFTLYILLALILALTLPLSSPSRSKPELDGQIIAIVGIAGFFSLFTIPLYMAHVRLTLLNSTTIEDLSTSRMRSRERAALAQVYGFTNRLGKKATKKAWNQEWGRIGKEGNLWWLGSKRKNWESVMGENKLSWFLPIPAKPFNNGVYYPPNPRHSKEGFWRRRNEWPEELR